MAATLISVVMASVSLTACGDTPVPQTASSTEFVTSPTPTPTPTPIVTETLQTFSSTAVDYLMEIAFGAEFGSEPAVVHKWTQDVRIAVHGDPNADDLAALDDVVGDLNNLIDTIEISVVTSGQNVELYFAPESEFASIEPGYVPVNMGFFWTWWDGTQAYTAAHVLVSTTDVTQAERNHLIREELTQSMGLMQDSYTYEDSMFYQGWTETPAYSDLDEQLIQMLYLPGIEPGLTADEALGIIPRG
jgi:hypothetical protein